jgi:hypothetical protein
MPVCKGSVQNILPTVDYVTTWAWVHEKVCWAQAASAQKASFSNVTPKTVCGLEQSCVGEVWLASPSKKLRRAPNGMKFQCDNENGASLLHTNHCLLLANKDKQISF